MRDIKKLIYEGTPYKIIKVSRSKLKCSKKIEGSYNYDYLKP